MIKKYVMPTGLILVSLMWTGMIAQTAFAQDSGAEVKGIVWESGSGLPLNQVVISVSSTGASSATDSTGNFTLAVPDLQAEVLVNLPGYNSRTIYLNGRDFIEISLVPNRYRSMDNAYYTPLGTTPEKDAPYPFTAVTQRDLALSQAASFDQQLLGRAPGMLGIDQSGMPGHRTFMNIRGFSSLYAHNEPLLFIDGMIHEHTYARNSLMEGFSLNPMDVLDIDDISDISVLRDGASHLGSAGSNGVIYVNTEQRAEASTVIKFSAYGGVTLAPQKQNVLNAEEFQGYFEEMLTSQGYNTNQINEMYPWLNGGTGSEDYYKYNNSTDWQEEIFTPAAVSKFHFFLKGGDDIATYNISTGYLSHKGIYENSSYSRFNLRINGKVNITDRFSVTPNAKLSQADSQLANQGPTGWKNPVLSSVLDPSIMAPYARDVATGETLNYLDDVGVFDVSNPVAIVNTALGDNRNYNFLSSIRADYRIGEHFNIYTLVGINYNNARENLFLPNLGMVQADSAYNSPSDFVNEFRSTQSHSAITYTTRSASGHEVVANLGFRYMQNSYKYNLSTDLNTPSDDFKSLGDGSQYSFLRSTIGDNRELVWVSYFGDIRYNYRNKYYLSTNLSYDGNSAVNDNNRYSFFPSVAGAWRLSSEGFLNSVSWLEDLRLRGSYSVTGNMYSTVYDYSKLYYRDRRLNGDGIVTREVIPNEDLELEKKGTLNAGLDLSVLKQLVNLHVDLFQSSVNNLVIRQELPDEYGFTTYFDNGGKLDIRGLEVAGDARLQIGSFTWKVGGSVSKVMTEVKSLEFLNPATDFIVTSVPGGAFITSEGNPVNAYYGYRTEGIVSAAEAGSVTGPKGLPMQAGDVKYADLDGNQVIDQADKTIIGDPNPDLFGSLFTSFRLGSLELFAAFNYSLGNDVYNFMRYRMESMDSYNNQSTAVLDRWTSTNTGASVPRASYGDPTGNTVFSDRWIEDGSYLRLGQLTLSYFLPSIAGLFQGVTFYMTATNLLTITEYSGYDPEFIYMNSPFYMGIDYGMMPQSRSFIAGLKLDL